MSLESVPVGLTLMPASLRVIPSLVGLQTPQIFPGQPFVCVGIPPLHPVIHRPAVLVLTGTGSQNEDGIAVLDLGISDLLEPGHECVVFAHWRSRPPSRLFVEMILRSRGATLGVRKIKNPKFFRIF